MITLPSLRAMDGQMPVRVFMCLTPTNMRCGFDTLAQLVREAMGGDPLSGDLFLFTARRRDRLKILYWDRDGLAIWYKRLEEGTFRIPRPIGNATTPHVELKAIPLSGSDYGTSCGFIPTPAKAGSFSFPEFRPI